MGKYSSLVREGLSGSILDDDREPKFTNPTPGTISAANVVSTADTKTGLSSPERANLSALTSPGRRLSYLEETYGKGNALDIDGDLYVNKDGNWLKVDEEGFSGIQDLADFAAPSLQALPGLIAGLYTGNPYVAGAADAAGDAMRQLWGASLPGAEERPPQDRAFQTGMAGLLGAATQGTLNSMGGLFGAIPTTGREIRTAERMASEPLSEEVSFLKTVSPNLGETRAPREYVEGVAKMEPPRLRYNQGIDRAAEDIGMNLSLGDRTQNPMIKGIEGALRRNPASSNIMLESDAANSHALYDYLRDLSDGVDPEVAGAKLKEIGEGYLRNMVTKRSRLAGPLFQQAIEESGDARIFVPNNYIKMLEQLTEDIDSPLVAGADAVSKQKQQYKNILENLFHEAPTEESLLIDPATGILKKEKTVTGPPKPKKLTISELQRGLQHISESASGTGKLFEDLGTAQERRLARKLKQALEQDFDELVTQDVPGAKTLKKAREAWRRYSQIINKAENRLLADNLEGTIYGEKLVEKIMSPSKMSKKAVDSMVKYLGKNDPEALQSIRKLVFQNVLEKSTSSGSGLNMAMAPFSPSKALSTLASQKDLLESLYKNDLNGWVKMQNAIKGLQVLSQQMGAGSPTAPLQWAGNLISGAKYNPKVLVQWLNNIYKPQNMARLLADGKMSGELAQLAKPKLGRKALMKAIGNISLDDYKYQLINSLGEFGNVPETGTP